MIEEIRLALDSPGSISTILMFGSSLAVAYLQTTQCTRDANVERRITAYKTTFSARASVRCGAAGKDLAGDRCASAAVDRLECKFETLAGRKPFESWLVDGMSFTSPVWHGSCDGD